MAVTLRLRFALPLLLVVLDGARLASHCLHAIRDGGKKYAILPLLPKVAGSGSSPGPESFAECWHLVTNKLQADKHVAACDGTSALQKCATGKQISRATGVSHLRNVFTPLSVISKTGLSAQAPWSI